MLRLFRVVFLLLSAVVIVTPASAVTPSPAMIEQLKQLPRAEQERLAKEYGFDLNQLNQLNQNNTSGTDNKNQQGMQLTPKQRALNEQQQLDLQLEQKDEEDEGPKRFGMNLFDSEISTFAPTATIPVPDSYILGPDDTIKLQLYGKVNAQYDLTVTREGELQIPELGNLSIAGLTFNETKNLVQNHVKQSLLGVEAAVSMGTLRTINIFVAGEAKHPGSYTVSALTSVTQALFIAGGVSDIGSLRDIRVQRSGSQVASFDLYDLLLRGNARQDVHLQNGDVVFIAPVRAIAEVRGEVRRPALFEVTSADTLSSLLAMAGGVKEGGYQQSAVLERFNQQSVRTLKNIDLTDKANSSLAVKSGDVLRIGLASPRIENRITVAGAVVRPGVFAWYEGIRVNNLLGSIWSDLHITVDLDYALILRETNKQGDLAVLQFDLGDAISQPDSVHNVALNAGDTLLIFHYGNTTFNRAALNKQLSETLKARFELPEMERWLANENLADEAFASVLADTADANSTIIAEHIINDNISQRVAQSELQSDDELVPFSYEALVIEQQKALQQTMQSQLNQVLYDPALLPLSQHLTRRELLYPVLDRLKRQARNGQVPQIVNVQGEVLAGGEYPLAQNAGVAQLIYAAGGLKDSAHLGRAELTRISASNLDQAGVEVQHLDIALQQVLSGEQNISLHSRDTLNIFAIPDWNMQRSVEIRGEVKFPGRYTVQRGESLSSLIKRAGGLTGRAFASGAVFTREQVRERETLQMRKLIEQLRADVASRALSAEKSLISPADAVAMIKEIEKQQPVGRLVIDLPSIVAENPAADINVENGDVLYIPRHNSAITVVGEVQHASSHRFSDNKSLEYYLQQAGGFRKRADEDRVYVIRADGSVMLPQQNSWFSVARDELSPGDTIVVPLDTEYKDSLSLWSQVTQIFYQSAVALAAINGL